MKNIFPGQKEKRKHKAGLPPGSVIFTGEKKVSEILIHYIAYSPDQLVEQILIDPNDSESGLGKDLQVKWFDTRGLHDTDVIVKLGSIFKMHALVLEDITDVHQRPKWDEYEDGIFISLRSFLYDSENHTLIPEQISLFLKHDMILSFQENELDLFESVRTRIKVSSGKIRTKGASYLLYALLDNIIDKNQIVASDIEAYIEELEDEVLENPEDELKDKIHRFKKDLLHMQRFVTPLREVINKFARSENVLIDDQTRVYTRDLKDHVEQLHELLEGNRVMLTEIQNLFNAEVGYRMNKVMQLLTLIASIFIPLTFLAGIYGMNFENMPELSWEFGYFGLLLIMMVIFISLIIYFRRKKWV